MTRLHDRAIEGDLAVILTERRIALHEAAGGGRTPEFSQRYVAEIMGVSRISVSLYESGVNYPGTLARWALWAMAVNLKFVMPRIEI